MISNKHTPGPWKLSANQFVKGSIYGSDSYLIASVSIGQSEYEANAKLIAAAPELLAACEMALPYLELPSNEITRADFEQIKAAIKKATE